MAKAQTKQEKQWEAEDAARTLVRAEEIKSDGTLLARALKELRKQKKATTDALSDIGKQTEK